MVIKLKKDLHNLLAMNGFAMAMAFDVTNVLTVNYSTQTLMSDDTGVSKVVFEKVWIMFHPFFFYHQRSIYDNYLHCSKKNCHAPDILWPSFIDNVQIFLSFDNDQKFEVATSHGANIHMPTCLDCVTTCNKLCKFINMFMQVPNVAETSQRSKKILYAEGELQATKEMLSSLYVIWRLYNKRWQH